MVLAVVGDGFGETEGGVGESLHRGGRSGARGAHHGVALGAHLPTALAFPDDFLANDSVEVGLAGTPHPHLVRRHPIVDAGHHPPAGGVAHLFYKGCQQVGVGGVTALAHELAGGLPLDIDVVAGAHVHGATVQGGLHRTGDGPRFSGVLAGGRSKPAGGAAGDVVLDDGHFFVGGPLIDDVTGGATDENGAQVGVAELETPKATPLLTSVIVEGLDQGGPIAGGGVRRRRRRSFHGDGNEDAISFTVEVGNFAAGDVGAVAGVVDDGALPRGLGHRRCGEQDGGGGDDQQAPPSGAEIGGGVAHILRRQVKEHQNLFPRGDGAL